MAENEKVNHFKMETWMLTQRIGPLNLADLKQKDHVIRVYFDKFVESEDGTKYKGEWYVITNFLLNKV